MSNQEQNPGSIAERLNDPESQTRLQAITDLLQSPHSSIEILRKLEKIAVSDPRQAVRAAALQALSHPAHRQLYSQAMQIPKQLRQFLVSEIRGWDKDGLLPPETAATLTRRYDFDFQPVPVSSPTTTPESLPRQTKPTLLQTLFSETSIKIALYLGAFFVIAAAMIFAAVIEALRLPILVIITGLFGAGAFLIHKKLPQPSFTLFIIFSVLLPIDFGVLAEMLPIGQTETAIYWMFVFAGLCLLWCYAAWFYSSRFFSLTAFLGINLSLFHLADAIDITAYDLYPLVFTLGSLIGLAGVKIITKWQSEAFSAPLFWVIQTQQLILLPISIVVALLRYDLPNTWWIMTTITWAISVLFYIFSHRLKPVFIFQYLAVFSALPITWLFLNAFEASRQTHAIALLAWGILLIGIAEMARTISVQAVSSYNTPLSIGALTALTFAISIGAYENPALGFVLSTISAVIFFSLSLLAPRSWTWSFALFSALFAYFAFFELDWASEWNLFVGYQWLIPTLVLLIPDTLLKNDFKHQPDWRNPPRFLGMLLGAATLLIAVFSSRENSMHGTIILGIFAGLSLVYAWRYTHHFAYAANTFLFLAAIYFLRAQDISHWLYPLISLAALYYLTGLSIEKLLNRRHWATLYRISGLVFGTLVALSAPFEDTGLAASLPVVIAAALYTVEAFKQRNTWLGFPANLLYLMAYFMILIHFKVDQPQFFTVGAAVLGMLMHYLLMRSGSNTGAFITGMLSQLVLLSTTYIQMVAEETLLYFAILFFQALVVLLYGIVIRSRSLVITPIIFLVISVLTLTFGYLEGLPSILLIGCTGILLIAFGIAALLLREKFAALREHLEDWNA